VGVAEGTEPSPGQHLSMTVTHVNPDRGELQLQFG